MASDIEIKLIKRFLELNYSVTRIKIKMRFKRAIVLDTGKVFILSKESPLNELKFHLALSIKDVFNIKDDLLIEKTLNNFLQIK